jgi:hypothetical protein
VPRAEVEEQVVAQDDEQTRCDDAQRIAARQAGKPSSAPEDEREPGHGDGVAEDRDVDRLHALVERRLDDGEGARPHDHDSDDGQVRARHRVG